MGDCALAACRGLVNSTCEVILNAVPHGGLDAGEGEARHMEGLMRSTEAAARGVVFIHSCPRALISRCRMGGATRRRAHRSLQVVRATDPDRTSRCEMHWFGPVGAAAAIVSALRGFRTCASRRLRTAWRVWASGAASPPRWGSSARSPDSTGIRRSAGAVAGAAGRRRSAGPDSRRRPVNPGTTNWSCSAPRPARMRRWLTRVG